MYNRSEWAQQSKDLGINQRELHHREGKEYLGGSIGMTMASTRRGEGTRRVTRRWPGRYTLAHGTEYAGHGRQTPPLGCRGRGDPGRPHWTCSQTGTQKGRQGSGQLLARALGQSVLRYRRMHTRAPGKRHQRGVRRGRGRALTCSPGGPPYLPISPSHL